MNLLATASDLQVKGLSQIQESRSQSTPTSAPEVKSSRQASVSEVKIKPQPSAANAAEASKFKQTPAPEVSKTKQSPPTAAQEVKARADLSQNTTYHYPGGSVKRKHDQMTGQSNSVSGLPDRISVHKNSSNSCGGGNSCVDQLPPPNSCDERLAIAVTDLKSETTADLAVLAQPHTEDIVSNQVPAGVLTVSGHLGPSFFFGRESVFPFSSGLWKIKMNPTSP